MGHFVIPGFALQRESLIDAKPVLLIEDDKPEAFEFHTGLKASEVGFVTNNMAGAGCSPDSLIPAHDPTFALENNHTIAPSYFQAGLEIKCVKPCTQVGYLLGNKLPDYYKPQVHWSMAVTGIRKWWFLSYHPDLNPLCIEVEWSDYTSAVESAISLFTINFNSTYQEFKAITEAA